MKLRKQIKNRVVAVAMLAVVLFGSLSFVKPETAYAASFSYTAHNWDSSKNCLVPYTRSINPTSAKNPKFYVAFCTDSDAVCFFVVAEDKPFDISYTDIDDGVILGTKQNSCDGSVSVDGKGYYYHYFGESGFHTTNQNNSFSWAGASKVFSFDPSVQLSRDDWIYYFVSGKLPEGVTDVTTICNSSTDQSAWQGSQDNPIPDENIGTLVIEKSKCYWVKDGSMDVSQRVRWANKTDTDFSLTNNKYAITRIEVKIGNRVTYFGDVEHHGTGKKVDNFGKVYPFKYVIATDNPHDFSFKDMLSASKTDLSKYNAAMLEHEYDLYFRVVCGTAYGTSAEWHCGNWTRYRVTDDPKQDGKNESDNGHFNDNGEWEKDKDTDVDSGGIGNVDDKDDLEDDFNHFKDSENWKDWLNKEGLDLDSAKTFIDQVADVPKMIGDLFSFFPDWVKYSFALGFALIPVIIVIKFLRG